MKQRWVRVLVYEGDADWIAMCQSAREVKGSLHRPSGVIKEAIIGDFLESLIPLNNEEQCDD